MNNLLREVDMLKNDFMKKQNSIKRDVKSMNEDTFRHHVNKEKNDFSNWVKEVIKEEDLAKELFDIKSKTASAERIKKYIIRVSKKEEHIHFLRQPILEFIYGLVVGLVLGMFVSSFI